jgi:hypothetical protein
MTSNTVELSSRSAWRLGTRIAFRFAFAWFLIINLPFPLNIIPPLQRILALYDAMWNAIVLFVGRHMFSLATVATASTGSGDRAFDYLLLLCQIVIATFITIAWSVADRRRTDYARLYEWLRIYVRFALAATMISYGAYKVVPSQFQPPTLGRLVQPFGEASPMGLLWTFMGASTPYTVFTGAAEMIGGLLLIPRRTSLLGALVCAAVLSNVVMLNFSYDVPVKIFSTVLLIHALFLILPDARRLIDFFLFARAVAPAQTESPFRTPRMQTAVRVAAAIFVVIVSGFSLFGSYQQRRRYAEKSPLTGIWTVEEFVSDGVPHPPLMTDARRWRRVIFQYPFAMSIQLMDDSLQRFAMTFDQRKKSFVLSRRDQPDVKFVFTYSTPRPDTLAIDGTFENKHVTANVRRVASSQYLLVSRGFHWINEVPFNR